MPKRLYRQTLIAMAVNSVASQTWKNFYLQDDNGSTFDALEDGDKSCAFFVSSLLTIMGKIESTHGTINSTEEDLIRSGWRSADNALPADIIIYSSKTYEDGSTNRHIAICVDASTAISASYKKKAIEQHDIFYRSIDAIYRLSDWDS